MGRHCPCALTVLTQAAGSSRRSHVTLRLQAGADPLPHCWAGVQDSLKGVWLLQPCRHRVSRALGPVCRRAGAVWAGTQGLSRSSNNTLFPSLSAGAKPPTPGSTTCRKNQDSGPGHVKARWADRGSVSRPRENWEHMAWAALGQQKRCRSETLSWSWRVLSCSK